MSESKRTLKMGWRELWPVWAVFGGLAGIGFVGFRLMIPAIPEPHALPPGQDLTLPVSQLDPAKLDLFAYPLDSTHRVEFAVERDRDSAVTVTFASCRKCYRSRHYRQAGQIVCGVCNEPMERLSAGHTPAAEKDCQRLAIPFERSGDRIIIRGDAVRDAFLRWYVH